MISTPFRTALLVMAVAAIAGTIVLVKMDNARLRKRVALAQQEATRVTRLREENARTRLLLAQADAAEAVASSAVRTEADQLRAEIARWEKDAHAAFVRERKKAATDADVLSNNRDLRRGLVRLEHVTTAGRATPDAAFQTLVWSALKGDAATLESVIALPEQAREKAAALITGLPETARAAWTPEKLAALFFTGFLNEVPAAAIDSVTSLDADHATLTVRLRNGQKENTVPFGVERSSDGWRVVMPEKAIDSLRKRVQAAEKISAAK
jgi:hypothetical protein